MSVIFLLTHTGEELVKYHHNLNRLSTVNNK